MVYHYEVKVNGKTHYEESMGFRQSVIARLVDDLKLIDADIDSFEIQVIVKRGRGPAVWTK